MTEYASGGPVGGVGRPDVDDLARIKVALRALPAGSCVDRYGRPVKPTSPHARYRAARLRALAVLGARRS